MTGFEPATSCSQSRRATKLRYIPRPLRLCLEQYNLRSPDLTTLNPMKMPTSQLETIAKGKRQEIVFHRLDLLTAKDRDRIAPTFLVRIPKHSFDPLRVLQKSEILIKIHHMGIGKQGNVANIFTTEFLNCMLHKSFA